jgi:TRAP-type mannitol/chloroaromatic compound transport system substrate-binding protein
MKTLYLSAALAVAVSLSSGASAQGADFTWKVQTLYQAGDPQYKHFEQFVEDVATMSDGRLEIQSFTVGSVVSAAGTLDAVKAGVLDGHFSYAAIWSGLEPGFAAMSDLTGAYENEDQVLHYFYGFGGLELMREMYAPHNMYTIGVMSPGHESLPSRVKLETVEDFKGIKIRMPGGIPAQIMVELGASPVTLPLSEAFPALEKGIVDAADAGTIYYNEGIGIYEEAGFTIVPGFHSTPIVDLTVNASKWEELPGDLKRILEVAMRSMAVDYVPKRITDDEAALARALESGVEVIEWSEAERAKFRNVSHKVWEEWATKGELAKRGIETQVDYLTTIGLLD